MKILALGDLVGEASVRYLTDTLWQKRKELGADLVVVNGENVCDVHGLAPRAAEQLVAAGADVITSGNHIFDRRDAAALFESELPVIRPCNYPSACPGEGARLVTSAEGWRVLCVNVSGTAFMEPLGDPYRAVEAELDRFYRRYDLALLDVHAEATSEKLALARYFDGRFAVVFGTHTHVATADEQVLPGGTGYITDLGMTGPTDGILGVCAEAVIEKMRTRMPHRFTVAAGPVRASGALFEVDAAGGRALSVSRITF